VLADDRPEDARGGTKTGRDPAIRRYQGAQCRSVALRSEVIVVSAPHMCKYRADDEAETRAKRSGPVT
jgi:hypothetical protein